MTTYICGVSILLLLALGPQSKPAVTAESVGDYKRPPDSIAAAIQSSSAVIVGDILAAQNYQPPIEGAGLRMQYTVRVVDVIRNHPMIGLPDVAVYRMGGDLVEADRVVQQTERGFPRFTRGRRYVMFLSWNVVLGGFEVMFGPDGAYELRADGKIVTDGHSGLASALSQRESASIVSDLKQAATPAR